MSAQSVERHTRRGHFALAEAAMRAYIEQRQGDDDEHMVAVGRAAARRLDLAERVMDRVIEALDEGDLQPTVGDGLKAAQLHASLLSVAAADDHQRLDWADLFPHLFTVAKSVMTEEAFKTFARRLTTDPIIRAALERADREADRAPVRQEVEIEADPVW